MICRLFWLNELHLCKLVLHYYFDNFNLSDIVELFECMKRHLYEAFTSF